MTASRPAAAAATPGQHRGGLGIDVDPVRVLDGGPYDGQHVVAATIVNELTPKP